MSKVKKLAKSKMGIIILVILLIALATAAFIGSQGKRKRYAIDQSEIVISGTGGTSWHIQASSFPISGDFTVERGELSAIENVSFDVPTSWFRAHDLQKEMQLKEFFQENNIQRISFKQRRGMVLPIMKTIHLVGELDFSNGPRSVAFQADYKQVGKNEITFDMKEQLRLSDFGIRIPENMIGLIDDRIEFKVQIRLINNGFLF